jgi:spore germination cell wall hydrolase CwlJ-like protein
MTKEDFISLATERNLRPGLYYCIQRNGVVQEFCLTKEGASVESVIPSDEHYKGVFAEAKRQKQHLVQDVETKRGKHPLWWIMGLLLCCGSVEARTLTARDVVAWTIWGEARGESSVGREAVATVIWNRAKADPINLMNVCLAPRQFSFWNTKRLPAEPNDAVWHECRALASSMWQGTFRPVGPWNHYYAHRWVQPYWARRLRDKTVIRNHTFGRL